jgi:hypothetical protein
MPINADPNETAPLSLKIDAKLPDETRPTFQVRFLTDSELRKLRRLLKAASEEKDEDKSVAMVEEALRVGIVDGKNLVFRGKPLDFADLKKFGDYFSSREVWELAYGQIEAITVGEQDRFSLGSQVASEPVQSAQDATAIDAK